MENRVPWQPLEPGGSAGPAPGCLGTGHLAEPEGQGHLRPAYLGLNTTVPACLWGRLSSWATEVPSTASWPGPVAVPVLLPTSCALRRKPSEVEANDIIREGVYDLLVILTPPKYVW